jgi:hypothetical protein
MALQNVCRRLLFLIASTLTLGGVLALFVAALAVGARRGLFGARKSLLRLLIGAAAAAFLLLALCVYASCARGPACRAGLSPLLVLVAVALLAAGVAALVLRADVVTTLDRLWAGASGPDRGLAGALEDLFACCGWEEANVGGTDRSADPCGRVIPPDVDKY